MNDINYINTVKKQGDGYIVNGTMNVPNDENNAHFQDLKKWLVDNEAELEFSLLALKNTKKEYFKNIYLTELQADIRYLSKTFQADNQSLLLMTQNLAIGSVPDVFYWKDMANEKIPMTFTDLQGLAGAIQTRGLGLFDKLSNLKADIDLVQTEAELENIIW